MSSTVLPLQRVGALQTAMSQWKKPVEGSKEWANFERGGDEEGGSPSPGAENPTPNSN